MVFKNIESEKHWLMKKCPGHHGKQFGKTIAIKGGFSPKYMLYQKIKLRLILERVCLPNPNWELLFQSLKAEGSASHSAFKYFRNHRWTSSLRVKWSVVVIWYYELFKVRWGLNIQDLEKDFRFDSRFRSRIWADVEANRGEICSSSMCQHSRWTILDQLKAFQVKLFEKK